MLMPDGTYAVSTANRYEWERQSTVLGSVGGEAPVPTELQCPLCNQLLTDAVDTPCCGKFFCDSCIREHLLENDFTCPSCHRERVSPVKLAPNEAVRLRVLEFRAHSALCGTDAENPDKQEEFRNSASELSSGKISTGESQERRENKRGIDKKTNRRDSFPPAAVSHNALLSEHRDFQPSLLLFNSTNSSNFVINSLEETDKTCLKKRNNSDRRRSGGEEIDRNCIYQNNDILRYKQSPNLKRDWPLADPPLIVLMKIILLTAVFKNVFSSGREAIHRVATNSRSLSSRRKAPNRTQKCSLREPGKRKSNKERLQSEGRKVDNSESRRAEKIVSGAQNFGLVTYLVNLRVEEGNVELES
ncbi:uncharacterized protein LOC135120932 [Zophobas morio]|uniref:uncharacterized protein LOC135120932 n=1 Tax=Zophobas morio TaxID=2755281 RepID=UPI00308311E4